jgi:hypothetical protein
MLSKWSVARSATAAIAAAIPTAGTGFMGTGFMGTGFMGTGFMGTGWDLVPLLPAPGTALDSATTLVGHGMDRGEITGLAIKPPSVLGTAAITGCEPVSQPL